MKKRWLITCSIVIWFVAFGLILTGESVIDGKYFTTSQTAPVPMDSLQQVEAISSDPHKRLLMESLVEAQWSDEELDMVRPILADPRAVFYPQVLEKNATHVESHAQYEQFLTPKSVKRSFVFLMEQKRLLNDSDSLYGVPPEIITAILRIESNFGQWHGHRSVFNVFWSLALGEKYYVLNEVGLTEPEQVQRLRKKAKWARRELRDFIHTIDHIGGHPLELTGSWAGAFGLSQFIPSSYRAYGRDGNDDQIIDLYNVADATASIGFYLQKNGWRTNSTYERRRKAIITYNHSTPYAECILTLAESLVERQQHN
ncbi:MAG: lytic murein transglycosylase [Candidatus Electryoneaceae bacterium]|nr:lytic murein transglycosylase [Candidatus Electryoneaceae bacterium]